MSGDRGIMKTEKHIELEVKKLRKVLNSKCFDALEKQKAFLVLTTLQWVRSSQTEIGPVDLCGIHGPSYKQYLKKQ